MIAATLSNFLADGANFVAIIAASYGFGVFTYRRRKQIVASAARGGVWVRVLAANLRKAFRSRANPPSDA